MGSVGVAKQKFEWIEFDIAAVKEQYLRNHARSP
jgi:hypothetical protein